LAMNSKSVVRCPLSAVTNNGANSTTDDEQRTTDNVDSHPPRNPAGRE
jgi:hypothetical protein